MAIKTPQEWLELCDDALFALISGGVQSYSLAGKSFTKNDIRALEDLRRYWEGRASESRLGFTTTADMSRISE